MSLPPVSPPPADPGFSAVLRAGVALFNARRFFEAHDVWEERWRSERGEAALLLQGLIQVAAAFVKWQRDEPRGMASLLRKGVARLRRLGRADAPLDLRGLVRSLAPWQKAAASAAAGAAPRWPGEPPRLEIDQETSRSSSASKSATTRSQE